MIYGQTLKWIKTPFLHQKIRKLQVFEAYSGVDKDTLEDYLLSYDDVLASVSILRQTSFESDYRRRSQNFKIELDPSPKVLAYARPDQTGTAYLSRGLIIALEDACQSVTSDFRSFYALNSDDAAMQELSRAPDVAWLPQLSNTLDSFRYVNYAPMIEIAKMNNDNALAGLFHKLISHSQFRQDLGDFLSLLSVIWVSSHEDAHFFLGHINYFNEKLGGLPEQPGNYFSEFVGKYTNPQNQELRLSAELAADSNAAVVLTDHLCFNEMFSINPFLNKHISYMAPMLADKGINKDALETIYLFRLAVVAATIAIAVFERNTIKNSSMSSEYPTLGIRILNIVQEISGRIQAISQFHPERELTTLTMDDWIGAFLMVQRDIETILLYLFEQGFVLRDGDVKARTVIDVLEFKLDKQLFSEFASFLIVYLIEPKMINFLNLERKEELIEYFSKHLLAAKNSVKFVNHRLAVPGQKKEKVEESLEFERKQYESLAGMLKAIQST
jgi:hypothetical protein